jgi:hypothetical protein
VVGVGDRAAVGLDTGHVGAPVDRVEEAVAVAVLLGAAVGGNAGYVRAGVLAVEEAVVVAVALGTTIGRAPGLERARVAAIEEAVAVAVPGRGARRRLAAEYGRETEQDLRVVCGAGIDLFPGGDVVADVDAQQRARVRNTLGRRRSASSGRSRCRARPSCRCRRCPHTTNGTTRHSGTWPTKWARTLKRVARAPGAPSSSTRVGMTPPSSSPPRKRSGK